MAKKMSELIAEFLSRVQSARNPESREAAIKTLGQALHATGPVLYGGAVWRANPYGDGHWRVSQDDPDPPSLVRRSVLPNKFRALAKKTGHRRAEKVTVPAPPSSDAEKLGTPPEKGPG